MKKQSSAKSITAIVAMLLTIAGAVFLAVVWTQVRLLGQPAPAQEPVASIPLPSKYRDWRLISVAHEAGKLNDLRAVLGNDAAIDAYRHHTLPFPNGTIIARLAWAYAPSAENNQAFGQEQSFVAGAPNNVQLMVKDSARYASTGGWGFAQYTNGKADPIATKTCYSCHVPAKSRDYIFTRYAP